jgi:hypothetical protein
MVCELSCVATVPPILLRLYSDGVGEVLLNLSEIMPKWKISGVSQVSAIHAKLTW